MALPPAAISCGWLWQSTQVAFGRPFCCPAWAPTSADLASALWHWAQVAVTCAGFVDEAGLFAAWILCPAPWHSRQEGVDLPAPPWALAWSFSPASWQSAQTA